MLKASPYVFSSVLAVYLLGIAIGSFIMYRYIRGKHDLNKRSLFFSLQYIIGLFVLISFIGYFYLTKYTQFSLLTQASFFGIAHPYFEVPGFDSYALTGQGFGADSFQTTRGLLVSVYRLFDTFFWSVLFIFVPTVLMGASFPLIAYLSARDKHKEGQAVGNIYFFNILGNVLGGIVTGFLLLHFWGTEITLLVFSVTGLAFGLFVYAEGALRLNWYSRVALVLVPAIVCMFLFPRGGDLYKEMHMIDMKGNSDTYFEEGFDGVVVTFSKGENVTHFINGHGHGIRPNGFYTWEVMEAISFAPSVDNVLIIGYGAGSTAEAVLKVKEVKKLVIVELCDASMKNLAKLPYVQEQLSDPRVRLTIDDGRRYLLRNDIKFDLILMGPLQPITAYSNNIYSKEFFELTAKNMKKDGIIAVWLGETRVLPKTIASVFDYCRIYYRECIASQSALVSKVEHEQRLEASFTQAELASHYNSSKHYLGERNYIDEAARPYPINYDLKPNSEYYLGLKAREWLFFNQHLTDGN